MPETLPITIRAEILRELPRFFGGPKSMVEELLQNAHRAGATHVNVTVTPESLTLTDNGRGLHDPTVLVTAGQSLWGNTVTRPAGLGVFSTLIGDHVREVTFESRGWKLSLTPQHLQGGLPALRDTSHFQGGFRVTVQLCRPLVPRGEEVRFFSEARKLRPLALTVNSTFLEKPTLKGFSHIRMPDADVHVAFNQRPQWTNHRCSVVVEGVPYPVRFPPETHLGHQSGVLGALASRGQVFIVLREGCLVQPKLPDRESLIDDHHLQDLLHRAAKQIRSLFLSLFSHLTLEDPVTDLDSVPWPEVLQGERRGWEKNRTFELAYLAEQGYHAIPIKETLSSREMEAEGFFEVRDIHHHTRKAVLTCDPAAADAWNICWLAKLEGFDVPAMPHPYGPDVVVESANKDSTDDFVLARHIGLHGRILPFLVGDQVAVHQDQVPLLLSLLQHETPLVRYGVVRLLIEILDARFEYVDRRGEVDLEGCRLHLLCMIAQVAGLEERHDQAQDEHRSHLFQLAREQTVLHLDLMFRQSIHPETRKWLEEVKTRLGECLPH